ncbi:hypothetical protein GCM10010885_09580 [Alicyclobacillus cellulosilyticus]|uniref:Uncharacterized protein n=1 Tax=Alicyclobacillus cellulosilyticus TaxID=1003997 RepID=A0A917K7W8_9BACL|nr:hypothetical protein GCM10010885_09580 [Alicyclobacillus cellulosilyticus]
MQSDDMVFNLPGEAMRGRAETGRPTEKPPSKGVAVCAHRVLARTIAADGTMADQVPTLALPRSGATVGNGLVALSACFRKLPFGLA